MAAASAAYNKSLVADGAFALQRFSISWSTAEFSLVLFGAGVVVVDRAMEEPVVVQADLEEGRPAGDVDGDHSKGSYPRSVRAFVRDYESATSRTLIACANSNGMRRALLEFPMRSR
jgi:hypothetical protein